MSKFKVLFQMTGSIACYKACAVISQLTQNDCEVQVVASSAALHFIGAATLEGLSGRPPITDVFALGRAMDYIDLARTNDVIVLCPATANSLNCLAAGLADDFIGNIFLAAEPSKPYLIFPAMNVQMLNHPITQQSLAVLKKLGAQVFGTNSGNLACGEVGQGRLLEPDEIIKTILSYRQPKSINPPQAPLAHVLITAGATREHVDDVRVLTNISSGRTGVTLAQSFAEAGFDVTFLAAKDVERPAKVARILDFESFYDFERSLFSELRNHMFDIVIHAAAVSDFSVHRTTGKIESDRDELNLHLKRNPKLVDLIKDMSKNKAVKLIAFKLTSGADAFAVQQKVMALFERSRADYIVHNDMVDLGERHLGRHPGTIYSCGSESCSFLTEQDLAQKLISKLKPKDASS